jgi:ferredoxin-NADP reductase
MTVHEIKLFRREVVAKDTLALTFEKPAGFTFKAGQAGDLTLINPSETDAKGTRRAFSIVSAPYEDELVVATRARDSAFKRILGRMPLNSPVQLEGPFGSLTLHSNRSRPAVFIAGGIGITPFISIIRQALHEGLPQVMNLLYSNRTPADAAFLKELDGLAHDHRGTLSVMSTMTDPLPRNGWAGAHGFIDADKVRSIIVRPSAPVFYVAGPPAMVAAMRELLTRMGIQDDDIRSEDFSGY